MAKSCLLTLALFVVLFVSLTAAIATLSAPVPHADGLTTIVDRLPPALLGGGLAALFLTFALGAAHTARTRLADRGKVARAIAGEPPREGPVAAAGTLVADGPLLDAPLSGARCAVFHYEVTYRTRQSGDMTSCWGYGLTPSHVVTPHGAVRLLGFTELDFTPTLLAGPEMLERTRRHFAQAQWVTIGLGHLGNAWKQLGEVMGDDDGEIRADFGPAPQNLEDARYAFKERLVRDRAPVCVFGHYSETRRGLVPPPGARQLERVRLVEGTAEQVMRTLRRGAIGQGILALVLAAVASGITYGFLVGVGRG